MDSNHYRNFDPALPATIGIWLIYFAIKKTSFEEILENKELVNRYLFFRKQLQMFLFILGTIVSLVTLSMGASLKALIATFINGETFPIELVMAYGGYYTFLIALLYLPVNLTLLEFGRRLVERLYPLTAIDSKEWDTNYEKHRRLEEVLRLKLTAQQSFETGIAILAPLLSGIVSFLLK